MLSLLRNSSIALLLLSSIAFAQNIDPPPASGGGGSGTVTSVSVTTANGVSGSVATPTTTPAITLTLGNITPTTVAIGGASIGSNALAVTGISTFSITTNPIVAITSGATLPVTSAQLQIAHTTTQGAIVELDGFTNNDVIFFRRADTSSTAPSAVQANEEIASLSYDAYSGSTYVSVAKIRGYAFNTQVAGSDSSGFVRIATTASGTTTLQENFEFTPAGGLTVGNSILGTEPGSGVIKAATSVIIGAGSAITSSGAGGALGTNAFTSTAYAPLASPTFTDTVTMPDAGTWAAGGINSSAIGATTASTGAFTTLSASSTVSGTGFSTYLASPPAIGGTAAAAGAFTTLSASGTITSTGGALTAGANVAPVNFTISDATQTGANNAGNMTVRGGNNSQASGTNNGGSVSITGGNASGAGSTGNGGSITLTGGTSIGGTAGSIILANLPTATGSYVCSSSGTISVEVTACPASDIAQKNPIGKLNIQLASMKLDTLFASLYSYKDTQTYGDGERVGLYAQDVEKMDNRCVTYKKDGTVSTYDDRCVIAYLVADRQNMKSEIENLKMRIK